MPRFISFLNPIPRQRGARLPRRVLAITATMTLLVGTLGPTWALAAGPETEGEGTAPPGLENPHFEPGGEEAALEALPGVVESGGSSEAAEGPPIETEPARESELPAPPAEEPIPPVAVEPEPPPPAEVPAPTRTPEYSPSGPEYVAPPPSPAPVENEAIVAPSVSGPPPQANVAPQGEPEAAVPESVAEAPPPVVPKSEQEAPPPAPAAVPPSSGSGGVSPLLRGRASFTVRPGDCLWSIADALLPRGAGNEEIAAEVARLWRLNAERIGTGDPNLILAGTVLVLR